MAATLQVVYEGQDNTGGATSSISSSLGNIGSLLSTTIVGAATAAGAAVVGFAASGVTAAVPFEHQLQSIAAVMRLTREEAGPLKDLILDLAVNPNLVVSATEAAEAVELLAKNGVSLDDILGGVAESTVALANATQADFGTAADIATDAMAIFGFQANEMGQVIDSITGFTTRSKFDIEDYGFVLANLGGISAAAGMSFQDMNAAVVAISPNFKSGATAATSLKNMINVLARDGPVAQRAMEEYGFSIFDAEGKMRSMGEISEHLGDILNGLTDKEKAAAAARLGGSNGMRAVLELAKLSEDQFNALSAEVNASGQAFDSAETRTQSAKGAMEIFASVVEGLRIQIGDLFLPAIRETFLMMSGFASDAGPFVVRVFEEWIDVVERIKGLDSLQTLLSTLASFLPDVAMSFEEFSGHVDGVGDLIVFLVDQGLVGLNNALLFLRDDLMPTMLFWWNQFLFTLDTVWAKIQEYIPAWQAVFVTGFGIIMGAVQSVIDTLNPLFEQGQTQWPILREQIVGFFMKAQEWALLFAAGVMTMWTFVYATLTTMVSTIVEEVWPNIQEAFASLTQALNNLGIEWSDVWAALGQATVIVVHIIVALFIGLIGIITAIIVTVSELVAFWMSAFAEMTAIIVRYMEAAATVFAGISNIFKGFISGDLALFTEGWRQWATGLTMIVKTMWEFIWLTFETTMGMIVIAVTTFISTLIEFFMDLYTELVGGSIIPDMWRDIEDVFNKAIRDIITAVADFIASLISKFNEAKTKISEAWNNIWTSLEETAKTSLSGVLTAVQNIATQITDLWNNMVDSLAAFEWPTFPEWPEFPGSQGLRASGGESSVISNFNTGGNVTNSRSSHTTQNVTQNFYGSGSQGGGDLLADQSQSRLLFP